MGCVPSKYITSAGQTTAQAAHPMQRDKKFSAFPTPGGMAGNEAPLTRAAAISFDSMNFLAFLPAIYPTHIITLQAFFIKFLLPSRENAAEVRPKLMKEPGHDAAHPMQSAHRPLSIFFPFASAQFIGHVRSQMPQETQPFLSRFNPKTETDEAKPITVPAGHQSQNRLPFAHENTNITRKMDAKTAGTAKGLSPPANSVQETTPRPKFAIGSMERKSGGTANITPAADTAATR
jgi:hypothetical protein